MYYTSNDAGSSPPYYLLFSSVFFLLLFTTLSYKTPYHVFCVKMTIWLWGIHSQPYSSVICVNKPLLTYAVSNFLFIAAVCALIPRSYSNVSINYSAINLLWYITIIATWWSSKLKVSKLETKYTLFAYNHRYYGKSVICIFFYDNTSY